MVPVVLCMLQSIKVHTFVLGSVSSVTKILFVLHGETDHDTP